MTFYVFFEMTQATIANLLFRTPELNRSQLGYYLAAKDSRNILRAFIDRFRLSGVRIDDGLRAFLGSLRLPNDLALAEHLLRSYGAGWLNANPNVSNDIHFAGRLVISIMELNDYLHSGILDEDDPGSLGNLFGFPNPAVDVDSFIAAFRAKDPMRMCPDDVLTRIYMSIRKERLHQAADNGIASMSPEIEIEMSPSRLPSRLTLKIPSEAVTVSIPAPDARFYIKLAGQEMLAVKSNTRDQESDHSRKEVSSSEWVAFPRHVLHYLTLSPDPTMLRKQRQFSTSAIIAR